MAQITDREFDSIVNQLSEIAATQKEILSNQVHCDSRHEESEFIANSDRDNFTELDSKVTGYEGGLIKAAIAVVLSFGVGITAVYSALSTPTPPTPETPKTEITQAKP
jgi:hypothetical protein